MQYAFFDQNGALDRVLMRLQIRAALCGGAHGVTTLGLATEVGKLSDAERRQAVEWALEDTDGRLPVGVTIPSGPVAEQIEFARWVSGQGASWVILQPPPERGFPESHYVAHFERVMWELDVPVAIQNAPEYLGVGLSAESISAMAQRHRNFSVIKAEGPATAIERIVVAVHGSVAVFNGRNGQELLDNLRAGCVGMIPATDTFDWQVRVFESMQTGDLVEAERVYGEVLPAIVFGMQSLESLICYGKRIAAWRMGWASEVYDRNPSIAPTSFGLACARRFSEALGPLLLSTG